MLKRLYSLLKAIPRLVYSCLKGAALLLLCCVLFVTLINALDNLPGPNLPSLQVENNLPLLAPSPTYDYVHSVVRLYTDNGFLCSGVVIGSNYILTASHCLVDEDGKMKDGVLTVVNDDGSVKVHAKAVGVYTRMDHGLITGNFKDIPGAKLSSDQLDIPKAVVACGYPLGSFALNCYLLIPRINDGFLIKCSGGPLLPGQSGGPVFDKSGNVVGLNVQVYDAEQQGGVAYTPVVGILSIFKIGR